MTRPRIVLEGEYIEITQSCLERRFMFTPDPETSNTIRYCIAVAVEKYGMELLGSIAEANHHHTILRDPAGRYPEFATWFHSYVARVQNRRFKRNDKVWCSDQMSVVRLIGRDAVIRKLVYILANPVKDMLVERAIQWPGFSTYREFINGTPLRARRPRNYFSSSGSMPAEIEVPLTIPEELGTREEVVAEVRAGVAAVEREMAEYRARTGKRVLGRRALLAQSWRDAPANPRKKRPFRPTVAGPRDAVRKALDHASWFRKERRKAWLAWCADLPAVFPLGTYKVTRRVVAVPIPIG